MFSESEKASYDAKIINNVLGSTKYVFEFDVDASVENNSKYGYKINLKERDAKNLEICNERHFPLFHCCVCIIMEQRKLRL